MPQVEFHILSEAGEVARLRYACQLVEQAYEEAQRVYIYAGDATEAQRMNELLWTFRDQAFIPHELLNANSPTHARLVAIIGTSPEAPTEYRSLLINLSSTLPVTANDFMRICEVIDADAQHKQLARERYKHYREQGCQLQTFNR